jgi:hypothetical protein
MGFARILSGGPDGRYTIELDWGQETKDTVLQALSALLAKLDVDLGAAQAALAAGREKEAALVERIAAEIAAIVAAQGALPPGSPPPDNRALNLLIEQRRQIQLANFPLRHNVATIKFDRAATLRNIAYWNTFSAKETRPAWCADLTEDRAPGSLVATLDIPGDDSLIVLAPEARAPTNSDGYLQAREMMSPAQAFFNTAIQPGWAKFLPTYRWGTITGMDYEHDRASAVQLADATLTGQRLSVNQASTLLDVPIVYMSCNSGPFDVGDRVVVEFQGQDWGNPRIIGFVDHPRPCNWVCRGSTGVTAIFESLLPDVMANISGVSIDIRGRLNGGPWSSLEFWGPGSTSYLNYFRSPNEADAGGGFREYEVQVYPVSLPGSAIIPCVVCSCHPPAAALESSDLSLRHRAEIAIYVSGQIVFNAAFTDGGWAGSAQRADGIYVKSPGGIAVQTPPHAGTIQVKRLTGYTLISEG